MKRDEGEDERLQVLYQVVKDSEAFRVLGLIHVDERTNLGGLKIDEISIWFCEQR